MLSRESWSICSRSQGSGAVSDTLGMEGRGSFDGTLVSQN